VVLLAQVSTHLVQAVYCLFSPVQLTVVNVRKLVAPRLDVRQRRLDLPAHFASLGQLAVQL